MSFFLLTLSSKYNIITIIKYIKIHVYIQNSQQYENRHMITNKNHIIILQVYYF